MKARPDCIACMFKQALNTARVVSDDPNVHVEVLKQLAQLVAGASLDQTPAALSQPVYDIVSAVTGVEDPYLEAKRLSNAMALEMVPEFEEWIETADDVLDAALHVAVAGNVIDFGIGVCGDMETDVRSLLRRPFAVSAIEQFREEIRPGRKLLYLGDNAGEIVLDQPLIKFLLGCGLDVTFTVKSGPIINDATMADAESTGMTQLVRVIETGSNDIGVNWPRVSEEFLTTFTEADLIIAKGHGNFETCSERREKIFFLLKAKCSMVANALGVQLGDIAFTASDNPSR